jgi:peptidoglycan/xylan/chitin deacetylase (PgdA/CDA1 family)
VVVPPGLGPVKMSIATGPRGVSWTVVSNVTPGQRERDCAAAGAARTRKNKAVTRRWRPIDRVQGSRGAGPADGGRARRRSRRVAVGEMLRPVLRAPHRTFAAALATALVVAGGTSVAAGGQAPPGQEEPVPVLMYHVVADPPAGAPYPELYVSRAGFAGQMAWLAHAGYHAVTLTAVRDHWLLGKPLPARPVVVSFDDGYRSQAVTAAPILRRHGWPGVIDLEVRNTRDFWGLPPGQVRKLIAEGWEVAAHSITHPDLTRVSATQLQAEVAGSRATLRRKFHVPVSFFCYPAGRYDDRVVAAVRAAGYLGATTTAYGLARPGDMFTLKRVRVNRSDGVAGFVSKLRAFG